MSFIANLDTAMVIAKKGPPDLTNSDSFASAAKSFDVDASDDKRRRQRCEEQKDAAKQKALERWRRRSKPAHAVQPRRVA